MDEGRRGATKRIMRSKRMKRFGIAALAVALLALAGPALAQQAPAKVEQPWYAQARLASPATASTTSGSTAVALPTPGLTALFCNQSASIDAYVALGNSAITVTTSNGS